MTLLFHLCLGEGLELTDATLGIFPGGQCLSESGAAGSQGPSPPLTPKVDYVLEENAHHE